jgi:hypothetical protein
MIIKDYPCEMMVIILLSKFYSNFFFFFFLSKKVWILLYYHCQNTELMLMPAGLPEQETRTARHPCPGVTIVAKVNIS